MVRPTGCTRSYPWQVWSGFFDLIYAGMSIQRAAGVAGVSRDGARKRWRKSCPVTINACTGQCGGLGAPPPDDPNEPSKGSRLSAPRRLLTRDDRAVIAAGLQVGLKPAAIARTIGRHRAVICREIARNSGPDGTYHAGMAHRAAHQRRQRPKTCKLIASPGLRDDVTRWLEDGWSPGLIATVLRRDHPGQDAAARMARVSGETIYKALYVQTRGSLRADLYQHLSLRRRSRRPRAGTRPGPSPYKDAFKISDRPAEVADRAVPGHWEGDLIIGCDGTAIGTLVERTTRFVILLHLPDTHDADTVAATMIEQMRDLPEHLRRSITWDRGTELARYERVQLALGTTVFFCDPHSPWQRGSNENTNRLLRHWFAKGSDLSVHTASDLRKVADTLNRRPRPTLDLQTPAQRLAELLQNPAA